MRKIILALLFLIINPVYSMQIYINNEEEIKNINVIETSTDSKNIFVIPSDLLKNLSDENKELIKKIQNTGQADFVGTTYTEVILPVLFKAELIEDAKEQIEKGRFVYYEVFGNEPLVFYPYMGIVSQQVLEILRESGYDTFISSSGKQVDLYDEFLLPEPDLSPWIGVSVQKLAWECLKLARTRLDDYAGSKMYKVEKFKAAMGELRLLQKPIWFENYISPDDNKKRENDLWFRAGLSNIYRVIGFEPPEEISVPLFVHREELFKSHLINLTTSEYVVCFNDEEEDIVISSCNIIAFGVNKSSTNISFDIVISSQEYKIVDIYIDMNGKRNAGSTSFLPGHNGFTDSLSAWEYAISVSSTDAQVFRYNRNGLPVKIGSFFTEQTLKQDMIRIRVPVDYIRGNPVNWGYVIAGILPSGNIFDIIGSSVPSEDKIIQIPALRMK
ncbi:MAG: hypothetical protein JW983_08540 [Elusimicrobia bacterium]|nr:hypothetical protein [Elusimicrobiota bacterium]